MNLDVVFKIIDHRTAEYKSVLLLRERILRIPFDLSFSEAELLSEKPHIQIIGLNGLEARATPILSATACQAA